ncbi:shikimate dehydrogenase [Fructilactobacillus myrtifloralis]|uniref:Shikimate dehydrogenase (NADP(+)) n=1 Tax=Fructilactobacillus myrtifloralis TaxID=2940301 RepID=A0ABY5BLG3_9LACO|nr:shikimate dehydrogenase [Fructilactobacillus myrtifloralis]USS84510.1 shikimate dehydrogenase [Fructilactobacillus myrtifloralis]
MRNEIDGHTILIGLMATPIRHSMSPTMHNLAFADLGLNYVYLAFEVDQAHLPAAIQSVRTLEMRGTNISMPNKRIVLELLDQIDPAAELINAVNTVVNDDGVLTGYNTDGIGFMRSLAKHKLDIRGQKMTLIGTGGAGTAIGIQAALDGVREFDIFNRQDGQWEAAQRLTKIINEQTDATAHLHPLAEQAKLRSSLQTARILVDATGVGMKPLANQSLINDPNWLPADLIVYDTVYAPRTTKLMQVAHQAGVKTVMNGLEMMLEQGAAAFKLWTGHEMPVEHVHQVLFNEE